MKIAVLMTCYNRRESTLRSLECLFGQRLPQDVTFEVWLVDDGSSDGTAAAVAKQFPLVRVARGPGDLYWNRGMCRAFDEASRHSQFDAVLLLNDDTFLETGALEALVSTASREQARLGYLPAVVGTVSSANEGAPTYGGLKRTGRHRFRYRLIYPSSAGLPCEAINGNCVLVPCGAVDPLLDRRFHHAFGDYDLGLRLARAGRPAIVAPAIVGRCEWNPNTEPATLRGRLRWLFNPKGLPLRDWFLFTRTHGGAAWPLYFLAAYARLIAGLRRRTQPPHLDPITTA